MNFKETVIVLIEQHPCNYLNKIRYIRLLPHIYCEVSFYTKSKFAAIPTRNEAYFQHKYKLKPCLVKNTAEAS